MRRSNASAMSASIGRIVVALGAALLFAAPVRAHVISAERGSVVVHPDRVMVEWQVHAEDFAHYYGLGKAASRPFTMESIRRAADEHADLLLTQLIIRGSVGERLAGKAVSQTMEPADVGNDASEDVRSLRVKYVFEYPLKSPPRHLSFQRSSTQAAAWSPSQINLAVRADGSDRAETVRLTRGANVETLEFDWANAGRGRPVMGGHVGELKKITAQIDVTSDEVQVAIEIPLPLLETFLDVERVDREFVEISEQEKAVPRLSAFLSGRNPIRINGEAVEAELTRLHFLHAGSRGVEAGNTSTRLGAWMTVVRFVRTYRCDAMPREFELKWNLFNSAILVAEATVACDGQVSTHRISTYEPMLQWSRPAAHGAISTEASPRASRLASESPSNDETVIRESGKSRE